MARVDCCLLREATRWIRPSPPPPPGAPPDMYPESTGVVSGAGIALKTALKAFLLPREALSSGLVSLYFVRYRYNFGPTASGGSRDAGTWTVAVGGIPGGSSFFSCEFARLFSASARREQGCGRNAEAPRKKLSTVNIGNTDINK